MSTPAPLTWIELSRSLLEKNIASLAKLASGRKLAVSVKANAYGHGLEEIVGLLTNFSDVDYVTIHSLEEAARCRKAGWNRKILVVGPLELSSVDAVLEYELEPVVTTIEMLQHLGKAAAHKSGSRHTSSWRPEPIVRGLPRPSYPPLLRFMASIPTWDGRMELPPTLQI